MYTIELAKLNSNNATKSIVRVMNTAEALSKLGSIPQVVRQKEIIRKIKDGAFWKEASCKI